MQCKHHGLISQELVYITPKGRKICRICKNEWTNKNRLIEINDEIESRVCTGCKKDKHKSLFEPKGWYLRYAYCRECRSGDGKIYRHKNRSHLKKSYGLTPQDFEDMNKKQNHLCKICGNPETRKMGMNKFLDITYLSVDHCHKTGKIRGLLCHSCNVALGLFKDNPIVLRAAADYLEANSQDT